MTWVSIAKCIIHFLSHKLEKREEHYFWWLIFVIPSIKYPFSHLFCCDNQLSPNFLMQSFMFPILTSIVFRTNNKFDTQDLRHLGFNVYHWHTEQKEKNKLQEQQLNQDHVDWCQSTHWYLFQENFRRIFVAQPMNVKVSARHVPP